MAGKWYERWFRKAEKPAAPRKALISLAEDQMITGRITELRSYGIQVDRVSISNEGKFAALPYPGTAFIPMRRVIMIQYLPDDASVEIPAVAEAQGDQ